MNSALLLLAQGGVIKAVGEWVLVAIVVFAIVGVGYVIITKVFKWPLPDWLFWIFWIVVGAFVGYAAVKFLMGMH